jgi:hypothetical protein
VGTTLQWIISYWKMTESWSVRKYYANSEITLWRRKYNLVKTQIRMFFTTRKKSSFVLQR